MLKTCTRCRSRRIRCDAQLPACRSCHKAGLTCSFYDHVLGQDVPRSYIKSLRDRIDELSAVLAVHEAGAGTEAAGTATDPPGASLHTPDYHYVLPTRSHQSLVLGPAPPVVIGDCTIRKLLQLGVRMTPTAATATVTAAVIGEDESDEFLAQQHQHARSNEAGSHRHLPPAMVQSLLGHYARSIEPVFPMHLLGLPADTATFADAGTDTSHVLRNLPDRERCTVLLACAVAAAHKSYHAASWRSIARTCRDGARELAEPLLASASFARTPSALVLLLLLTLYELADPDGGRACEYLSAATETCLALGWHRAIEDDDDNDGTRVKSDPDNSPPRLVDTSPTTPAQRNGLLSVLVRLERPLGILSQRPGLLANAVLTTPSDTDRAFAGYQQVADTLFAAGTTATTAPATAASPPSPDLTALPVSPTSPVVSVSPTAPWPVTALSALSTLPTLPTPCPAMVEPLAGVLAVLQSLPKEAHWTHEAWLLLHPLLVDHMPCAGCGSASGPASGLHARVVDAACRLVHNAHTILTAPDQFLPPVLAAYRAFMGGCVLVTAVAAGWTAGTAAGPHSRALLQCSEVLVFTAPCWRGGRDYYDVFQQVCRGLDLDAGR